jgi:hypothetical protein
MYTAAVLVWNNNNFKSRSGSLSGLDASIQAKKQAYKSHATVPLSLYHWPSKLRNSAEVNLFSFSYVSFPTRCTLNCTNKATKMPFPIFVKNKNLAMKIVQLFFKHSKIFAFSEAFPRRGKIYIFFSSHVGDNENSKTDGNILHRPGKHHDTCKNQCLLSLESFMPFRGQVLEKI